VFALEPYSYREARSLAAELGLAEPLAVMLVRRGFRTADAAREFIDGADEHDPFEFDSMPRITARLLAAARAGRKITVHGDYDVDGVCSTAILVRTLRELGAECDWLIPDRAADGYGLTMATIDRLTERGTKVLLTADCGISSAVEVAAAEEAGIETIVTDHHQPPEVLPDCPILHPVVSGYPFSELCATAVAYKLAVGLRREAGAGERRADAELELVALATVADMVPLVGENRRLVRAGLAEARKGARPGLRALIQIARADPARLDAGDLGFRIAPRINAAGRLYRADAGVELMLTEDPERATQIAAELDSANSERRATERDALADAERQLAKQDPGAAAIVLAGADWHPGVIGIVASRLVDRHWRPVILIAIDGETGRGSGRSIPGFDLVQALGACSGHLTRFGGHAAAAGLEIEAGKIEDFRRDFAAEAERRLTPEQLVRHQRVDAVVGVGRDGLGIELAEQLEQLAPFGSGNPEPRLLVPSATLEDVRPLGESGDHARFNLRSGAGRAQGVAFRVGSTLNQIDGPVDLSVKLEIDRWNGAVQPRVIVEEFEQLPAEADGAGLPAPVEGEEWWRRFAAELAAPLDEWPAPELREEIDIARAAADREVVDRRGGAIVAGIAELASSGAPVLIACADAARRRALVAGAADPRRIGADRPAEIVSARGGAEDGRAALERAAAPGGLALADWAAVAAAPGLARRFEHIVLIEPPPFEHLDRLVASGASAGDHGADVAPLSPGFLHIAWGEPELELAARFLAWEWETRGQAVSIYKALSQAKELAGGELAVALGGEGRYPRTPEIAARAVRVLVEAGLCDWQQDGTGGVLRVVSSEETDLLRSQAYRAYGARHEEGKLFLRRQKQPERVPEAA
jgi:single-stranded-DNA-specific exonuclease